MNDKKQIEEIAKILNECCNEYDEKGNHLGNKCASCEYWSDTNHVCVSYNTKEAEALYNAGYRKQSENVIELPCKERDTVYVLNAEDTECHLGVIPSEYACQGCEERECDSVRTYHIRELSNINKWTILDYLWQDRFGKDVFTTKDEAEKALAKMKGGAE